MGINWTRGRFWTFLRRTSGSEAEKARKRGAADAEASAIFAGDNGVEGPGIGVYEQECAHNAFWPVYDLDRDAEEVHPALAPIWSRYKSALAERDKVDAAMDERREKSEARTDYGRVSGKEAAARKARQVALDLEPLAAQRDSLTAQLSELAAEAEEAGLNTYRQMLARRKAEARERWAEANAMLNYYLCGAAPHLGGKIKAQTLPAELFEDMWEQYLTSLQGEDAEDGRFLYDFTLHLAEKGPGAVPCTAEPAPNAA